MFRLSFYSLFLLVIVVQALPIERKRDIYLTLPSQSKSTATQEGKSSFYTLDGTSENQLSSSSGYITSPNVITPAPTVQDPKAVWTVPMIPSGQFSPMPNIVHHVISTIAIPQSGANEPKREDGKAVEAKPEEAKKEGEPKPEEAKKEGEPKPEEPKPEEAKKEGEPKPEEAKKEDEPKLEEAKKEGEPKPEEAKKEGEPKPEEHKPEPKPAEPAKARRSLNIKRDLQFKQMVKRQEKGELYDKCTAEQQYIVPVTYSELQGLNEGTLKLQRLGSDENKTESPAECGENADVIVAPVSDEQMAEIQAGILQIVQLDQPGQVSLEPVEESTSGESGGSGANEEEQGPMYDVIPTNDSLTDEEVQDVVQDFTAGKNLLDQQYESEAEDVKNITGNLKSKSKSLLGQDQDIHITLRRRDHMIYVERKQKLTKRVEDPKIDDSKLIGNGAGKLKYGHKIHYNGVQDQFGKSHFYSIIAFVTMTILSIQLYL